MGSEHILESSEPILLVLNHGESLAVEVSRQLEAAERAGLKVHKINVDTEPVFGEKFQVGKHTVLVGWHNGEVIARRSRPWATDASEIVKSLQALAPDNGLVKETTQTDNQPVKVTDADFVEKVMKSPVPVVVDFWAEWCGPCKMIAPVLDKLALEFSGKVRVAKVNVDENPMLSQQFRIQSIPMLMFVKNGKIVGQSPGVPPNAEAALRDVFN
ncbi:MAG: thioredoxin, partial [Anaerolineae bacterium]|nr:thioredoxin [Anaerolineae bacterium]